LFWRLTPHEIGLYLEAAHERERRRMEMLAWHAANLMNMWRGRGRRAISIRDLMGSRRSGQRIDVRDFGGIDQINKVVDAHNASVRV